jgi:hypothetical protein
MRCGEYSWTQAVSRDGPLALEHSLQFVAADASEPWYEAGKRGDHARGIPARSEQRSWRDPRSQEHPRRWATRC